MKIFSCPLFSYLVFHRQENKGQENRRPLAVVILGGLAPSTILNLFLMPALYLRFGKSK